MNFNKLKRIMLIIMIGLITFLINDVNVYAKQKFPDYGMIPNGVPYCDYEIYTTNDDSNTKFNYNGHHLYFVYDGGTIKWINPNNGNVMSSGDRWDTDHFAAQRISYDANALTGALVQDNKLAHCPELYFKETNSYSNLSISLDASSVSHGGISGDLYGADGKSDEVTELGQPCSYLAKLCKPGDFAGDALDNFLIHRYSDGSISYNFENPEFSSYIINMNGIDESYFKNGCPTEVYLDCGGIVSEGTAYCNVVKESACIYTQNESNGASGHEQNESKDINTTDKDKNKNVDNSGDDECKKLLGDGVLGDIEDVLTWIRIAAPILVIVLGSVDFAKAVLSDDPKTLNKATSTFIKRLIAAVALFFAPLIIMYLIDFFNNITGQCSYDVRGL